MSDAGSWEVVGKSKKEKVSSKPMTKNQIKQFVENMPKLEVNDPMEQSQTMFHAFIPKEKKVVDDGKSNGVTKKAAPVKKKKVDQEKKESKHKTVEEALSQIQRSDLQVVFNQSQESFPENPDVWLKDLASFLNLKLEKVPETEAAFKNQAPDFPLCKMNKGCQDVLNAIMKKCSSETLEHLFYHCVQTMLTESQKGLATYGYRIYIQALAHRKPDIATSKFPQYLDLLKTHHNRPLRCLSILWSLGQVGVKKLQCGLRVWLDLMMPALGYRSIAPYCAEYLEELFSWHKDIRSAFGCLTLRDYFQVLDILFSPSANIQADLKKKLQAQYPKLKTIAFGENPSKNMRNFFPSYLSRATPGSAQPLRQELLSCLVMCLQTDKQSFSIWCQMYTKHLPQSSVLLDHINSNWSSVSKKIDKKMLRETIRSFSVTNDEITAQNRNVPEGLEKCSILCKELLQKMTQSHFPWFTLIMSVAVIIAGIVAYDVYTSPSFKRSRTVKFLEKYGVLAVLDQAWKKIHTFLTQVFAWLGENVPRAYNNVRMTVGPYLTTAWKKSSEFVLWAVDSSRPHRQYMTTKIVQGVEWVHGLNPDFWSKMGSYLWLCWGFVKDYTLWIWKYTLHLLAVGYTWLLQNVLVGDFSPENIHRTASWSLSVMRNYTVSFASWCGQIVTGK